MEVKKPGLCVQDGKKAATKTDDRTASKSVPHTLTQPSSRLGGKKAEFLGAGGYTKNSNRKFYKKAESPVSLFTG
jgi:hypothetical protein